MRKSLSSLVLSFALLLVAVCAGCSPREQTETMPAASPEAAVPEETRQATPAPYSGLPEAAEAAPEETQPPLREDSPAPQPEDSGAPSRSTQQIVREMTFCYANDGASAWDQVETLLRELGDADPDAAVRWGCIMELWRSLDADVPISYDVLPDGLSDTDSLCIVVLGFQLFPDGSMRPELIERLTVALRCAEQYPNACILCTGGPTAFGNGAVTEAGNMADWLVENGVDRDRVIVENRSLSTAQNAVFGFDVLEQQYPSVSELAIVSSDYHIATGMLVFGAESLLRAEEAGTESLHIVANAAYRAPYGSLSPMYRAASLIELSGDRDTAFAIYYGSGY